MMMYGIIFCFSAPTMYLSKQKGYAVSVESTQTIAAGLAPPYAGGYWIIQV